MMWSFGSGSGWPMWTVMAAGMIVFWAIVILVIRALWRGGKRRENQADTRRPSPLTLLQEHLARGEISPEQYEQRRRILVDGH